MRLYDRLFTVPEPDADGDFKIIHQSALARSSHGKMRTEFGDAKPELRYQFERLAYFALDTDSTPEQTCFQSHDHTAGHLGEEKRKRVSHPGHALEHAERMIHPREHFLFPENFEEMIKARAGIASSYRQARGMHEGADFDTELRRRWLLARSR